MSAPASVGDLARALASGPVIAYGMPPAYAAFAAARLSRDGLVIVVVPDEEAARALEADLRFWRCDPPGDLPRIAQLPGVDVSPYADLAPDRAQLAQRLTTLFRLTREDLAPAVVITTAPALLRRTIPRASWTALATALHKGETANRDELAARLVANGYGRVPIVEDAGTFAVRGGVIDVFSPVHAYPVRIDLFGDDLESLRLFDPQSQRTLREIETLFIHPVRETIATGAGVRQKILDAADAVLHPSKQTRRLLDRLDQGEVFVGIETLTPAFHDAMDLPAAYVPDGATWIVVDPDAVRRAAADELKDADARHAERTAARAIAFPVASHYGSIDDLERALLAPKRRVIAPTLELTGDLRAVGAEVLRFAADDHRALRADLDRARHEHVDDMAAPLAIAVKKWLADGLAVVICSDSANRADRLAGLLEHHDVHHRRANADESPAEIHDTVPVIFVGALADGFTARADNLSVVTAGDVFGARKAAPPRARSAQKKAKAALLGATGDFSQLVVGDYLVHQLHGVGRYRGLVKIPVADLQLEALHLEYDGGTLYLPVYRLGEVQRYVGAEGHEPRLDKLGGITWEKSRSKVSRAVRALAEELLQIYAQRKALPGHRFPPSDETYRDFEATFPFEETPDQQAAIDAVMNDMEAGKAMDRLVCGDVGYGKTEVALRAIFKAALAGKQAALLAPTTVLVEQHVRTMTERFDGWPINLGKLSRFQSKAEQVATVKALAEGKLDAVVGTHRLLSPDVRFKDLGLIVIDEEQRFGVAHKERLKRMRTQTDVLTLTATPIPRTLHLAMTGLRDLSIIATPPADRRAVRTFVSRVDDGVVKEAITRELARGGQVFFIARHITGNPKQQQTADDRSLGEWADYLHDLVPDAKIAIAHGQLPEAELERVMVDFVDGKADILVSTTIVESGLDIPRANTMFVARADAFGLSQLYQLRGRIGRSKERAYCYLLVPAPDKLTDEARRRLEALQRFTELGAGFHIASQDLEIRGGGELLGAKQSGSIAAVGFETYVRLLDEAVAEVKGEPIHSLVDPELTVDHPGFIPDDYVPDPGQRLDLYKRLSSAEDDDEIRAVLDEIADRYGPLPGDVIILADLMGVKAIARTLDATSLEITRARVALALAASTSIDVAQLKAPWKLTPDGRLLRALTADESRAPVEAARRHLQGLPRRAT
ncbi:MAG TPA: transcription-repair coupling factor [Kofleriaceae bacterium]|nr:transcription-repair coupling factor [Kofleriaceae bacterium]